MGAVRATVKLRTLDSYINRLHGRPRSLTPREMEVAERWVDQIVEYIRGGWPVDTGTSYDKWTVHLNPRGGQLSITIENDMYYAEYVHDGIWARLIKEAVAAVKATLIFQLKQAIKETEETLKEGKVSLLDLIRGLDLL